MSTNATLVPNLDIAYAGPLHHMEKVFLSRVALIESWFRHQWNETMPPLTSSVDLRNAGFKIAPVDTNLFPAGFNNLNPAFLPLCVQAIQSTLFQFIPQCINVLLLPENHTRNKYYLSSLNILRIILIKAGFSVRVGSLDSEVKEPIQMELDNGDTLLIEPVQRQEDRLVLSDFNPCILILNNDLSSGIPSVLQGIKQPITPSPMLGWATRFKSSHFQFFNEVAEEFSDVVNIDPWFITPYFSVLDGVDFMTLEKMDELAQEVDKILALTKEKYIQYGVEHEPFVVVKADNGTYGMSVMMLNNGDELRQLNRKQRTKMSSIKGSQKVSRVLIQEGIHSFEAMSDGAVAEPVIYMIGQFVVGGFYRVHQARGINENLNAPGMYFEPLAFAEPCNMPDDKALNDDCPNRFYMYGVIARLAALAAAREAAAVRGEDK